MSHRPSHEPEPTPRTGGATRLRRAGTSGIRGAKKDKTTALAENAVAESSRCSCPPVPERPGPPEGSTT
jgi:hypothetical protein